jgi:hypothetical protein
MAVWIAKLKCFLLGKMYYSANIADHRCIQLDYSLYSVLLWNRYGKHVKEMLGFEGELNDVRAFGSPPLDWYWEVGIRHV